MNVYDFDHTIYDGDCTVDFYLFLLKRRPLLIRYIIIQTVGLLMYVIRVWDKTKAKQVFYRFLKGVSDIDKEIELFWQQNIHKIKKWYYEQQQPSDVVISASPYFLVNAACKKINLQHVIASEVDKLTGKYTGKNCYGEEKVSRFYEIFPGAHVTGFYSDSLSDSPLAKISENSFIVTKDTLHDWKEYEKSKRSAHGKQ